MSNSQKKNDFRPVGAVVGLGAWAFGFMLFLYLPIVILVLYSFNASKLVMVWSGFSLEWYAKVFDNADIRRAALNSLIVASSATVCATVLATLAALVLVRGGVFRGRGASMTIMAPPLMVPEVVTAVALLIVFAGTGLSLGLGNVIIAHTTFCIPFAFLPIRARLEGMETTLEQASADLYGTELATFRYVTLPILMPGILAGAMLAFVISLDDFIITMMVSSAGGTTLPVYIYSMIRQGVTPEINAISTLLLIVSSVLVTLYWLVTRKQGDER